MKWKGLPTIGALTLFALSGTALATSVDLGEIADGESVGSSLFYGQTGVAIADTWSFTLTSPVTFTAVVVDSADLDPTFGISDFLAFDSSGALTFDYDASDNSYGFSGTLAPGTYQFDVTGQTSGTLGGGYQVLVGGLISPVPLPASVWLLLAAVGSLPPLRRRISG